MFNTFEPERLEAAIGRERRAFGMPFVQATLDADGRLKAAVGRGGGASWGEALRLARGVHVSFALIKSWGHSIQPQAKARIDRSPPRVMAAALWSMSRIRLLRELLATGEGECRALVDVMAEAAAPSLAPQIRAMTPG